LATPFRARRRVVIVNLATAVDGPDAGRRLLMKAILDRHRHLSYVLAGSSRGRIEELVTGRHRARWKAVDTLPLGPIPEAEFAAWIVSRSRASGVPLVRATPWRRPLPPRRGSGTDWGRRALSPRRCREG